MTDNFYYTKIISCIYRRISEPVYQFLLQTINDWKNIRRIKHMYVHTCQLYKTWIVYVYEIAVSNFSRYLRVHSSLYFFNNLVTSVNCNLAHLIILLIQCARKILIRILSLKAWGVISAMYDPADTWVSNYTLTCVAQNTRSVGVAAKSTRVPRHRR